MPLARHKRAQTSTNEHNSDTTNRSQKQPGRVAAGEESSPALNANRRRLDELEHQNDELLRARSVLLEKVSSLELALAKANQFAHYDELTGLPNRRLLLDRFKQASSFANRRDEGVALLFFDLNEFKSVNDILGHEAGDKLLQQVAIRLTNAIRKSDTACRYGGDEFVVLLTEINHPEDAVKGLQKIRAELALPYVIDRHSIRMAVSDGMAVYPHDSRSFTDLIRLSDHSMMRNKVGSQDESGHVATLNMWFHRVGQDSSMV